MPNVGEVWRVTESCSIDWLPEGSEIVVVTPDGFSGYWCSIPNGGNVYFSERRFSDRQFELVHPGAVIGEHGVTVPTDDHDMSPDMFSATETERSVLDDAVRLTRGDRNKDYGHPSDDYTRTAAMWSAFLGHEVTARQAMVCMALVKVSRLAHTPDHWDSAVDLAGYADCVGRDIERERLG